jgi:hypothetical protein
MDLVLGWSICQLAEIDPGHQIEFATSFLTMVSLLVAGAGFFIQQGRANKLQKTEIYQRLELASNEVFKFEAEKSKILEKYRDEKRQDSKCATVIRAISEFDVLEASGQGDEDLFTQYRTLEEERRILRKYYEQTLNLFEVAIRFRQSGTLEHEVFGSWVIWYYDTLCEWGFRWLWDELRCNYTAQLRAVFDPFATSDFETLSEEDRKKRFFIHVGRLVRCPVVVTWLDNAARKRNNVRYPLWILAPRG